MKTTLKLSFIALMFLTMTGYAQQGRLMQFERPIGRDGVAIFEAPKADTVDYDGDLKVRVGGDFSIIFQGLSQSNDLVGDTLVELASNLPYQLLTLTLMYKLRMV